MQRAQPAQSDERVLVLAPTGRDGKLACDLLEDAGITCQYSSDADELCGFLSEGAGAAILAQEALTPDATKCLVEVLGQQPPWSDFPLIVFTRAGGETVDEILETLGPLGNVTVLERPVRVTTLVSAVRAALRARRRQYEVRDLLCQLEDADRRKDEFLAMLGHELRNPLAAVRNALQVLDYAGAQPERSERQRRIIERQTRHLTRMVDDLLDVSRVTLGKISLQRQRVDLKEIAERCLQSHNMAADAQRHELSLSVKASAVYVDGDPVRLEQITSNLINNAIKYTPPGGKIHVSVAREDGQAVIRVRDNGIGIPPEMQPRIFELFTQAERSLDRSQGGLGLGLPLVSTLAELHGGRIEVHSEGAGRGSEFVVRLPVAGQAAEAHTLAAPPAEGQVKLRERCRLLVVEDNPDGRETLQELLELFGFHVEIAEDGPAGLRKALQSRPDVALIDIGLPGLDGYEVARRIRTDLNGSAPYLIAMSGYGQPDDRERAIEAGFDAYLVKPVDPDELVRILDSAPVPEHAAA